MAELKTQQNEASVDHFLNAILVEEKKSDCRILAQMMSELTATSPKMWGVNIVGYGSYAYKYASGQTGEWFIVGFAPRKNDITVYIIAGFSECEDLLLQLNRLPLKKYKTGKSCLYIKKLADIHLPILRQIISRSIDIMKNKEIKK